MIMLELGKLIIAGMIVGSSIGSGGGEVSSINSNYSIQREVNCEVNQSEIYWPELTNDVEANINIILDMENFYYLSGLHCIPHSSYVNSVKDR